ncbi:hypothetical protein DNTS_021811 [Danionella cerebrum]|uniref:Nuclear speckle splicing regulatory protein 1 n=1 Tax=Danionella cerebrum TaxID=2873325 RepID=A0A553R883_9TELE|nr:hypothetical protein DNTS_021811 [Danionella translucida]
MRSLTETHGLDVALGVGDRWTVTNAIQAPVNGNLKETAGGETDIIMSKQISRSSSVATAVCVALPLSDCFAHAPEPAAVKIRYGLILPQKKGASKSTPLPRPSVFGDDSDDETSVGESLQKEAIKKKMMKQTRLEMQKALEEDSTVYEYDNVYDDIQKERLESNKKLLGGKDKKPKYINQLLRAVEERKKEQERRDERKIQKEREAEGEQFADKEAFVTSAYREKLKERQEELEREKREAEIEGKQGTATGSATVEQSLSPEETQRRRESDAESQSDVERKTDKAMFPKSSQSKRHYRQKSPLSDSADEHDQQMKKEREKSHRKRDREKTKESRDSEDKYHHRKDDRERRRDKVREDDRHRRERDRPDRNDRRNSSPKERERDRKEERDRKRRDNSPKERDQKGDRREKSPRNKEREQDRKENVLKDKASKDELEKRGSKERGEETKESKTRESKDEKTADTENKSSTQVETSKFAKRSSEETVSSARDRYLARQINRFASKAYVEKEED